MNEPTHNEREDFRAFLNRVIAALNDTKKYVHDFPAPWHEDERGNKYQDPEYTATMWQFNQILAELEFLSGHPADEWLAAYMERKAKSETPLWSSFQAHLEKKNETV